MKVGHYEVNEEHKQIHELELDGSLVNTSDKSIEFAVYHFS